MFRVALLIILAACGFSVSCAQTPARADSLLARFSDRFQTLDSLIFRAPTYGQIATHPRFEVEANVATVLRTPLDSAIAERVKSEIAEHNAKTGLSLTGQVYARIDNELGVDEEEDPVSSYWGKVQVELRWYFLQSALFHRNSTRKIAELRGEIDRVEYEKERRDQSVYLQKEFFRASHDSLLYSVLLHRIENLRLLSDANVYLLQYEHISSDELLRIINELAEAERLLASLGGPFESSPSLSQPRAYIIDVDTAALMKRIRNTQLDFALLHLKQDLIDARIDRTSYIDHMNVAPFVRWSGYARRNGIAPSQNIDAGVSFTLPLNGVPGKQKQTLRTERTILSLEEEHIAEQLTTKVTFICEEIERLNRASIGEYDRVVKLQEYLRMRTEAYRNVIGDYSRLDRTKEYNTYLQCIEKLIDFQYRRDCLVADLQIFLRDDSVLAFCREYPISQNLNASEL